MDVSYVKSSEPSKVVPPGGFDMQPPRVVPWVAPETTLFFFDVSVICDCDNVSFNLYDFLVLKADSPHQNKSRKYGIYDS